MTSYVKAPRDELLALLPGLRRFAFALTGSRQDADDLMQATVERLLKKGVPGDVHLAKWTNRVCRNVWIDEIRSRKVRHTAPAEDVHPGAMSEDGERAVLNKITLKEVQAAMQQLPEGQRIALALVALEGYSYQQAAHELDVPVGTIMSRVARARSSLAEWSAQ